MPALTPPAIPAGTLGTRPQPVLTVDELTIRPWATADAPAVVAAYQDADIQRWHVRSMTSAEAETWIQSWADRWRAETGVNWAVTDPGGVVGRIGFGGLNLTDGLGEAAYWVVPAARGRRIAARALATTTTWMLRSGFHRLALLHSTGNLASCRVAVAARYPYEGTQREQARHQDGWHDVHIHARLADPADV